jgi:hypothetical protein
MAVLSEWGPSLWKILHTAAEHLGKPRPSLLQTDEANRWIFLLKSVENAMPCALCRGHYKEWLKKSPVTQMAALRGPALRDRARQWVYNLHEEVNAGKKVVSGITVEQLPEMYGSLKGFQEAIEKFIAFTKDSIQYGHVKADGLWQFRSNLHYLRKISDMI